MAKRTTEEWHQLFTAHTASGLSQKHFCKLQGLCPKHFTKRKKQLLISDLSDSLSTGFVKIEPTQPPIEPIGHVSITYDHRAKCLVCGHCH